jgi:hypothetical protein
MNNYICECIKSYQKHQTHELVNHSRNKTPYLDYKKSTPTTEMWWAH